MKQYVTSSVGGQNKTYIFSEQNSYFGETLTLNQGYNRFQISGQSVIAATGKEVYSFNIEGYTLSMPTHISSLPTAPSSSLSPSSQVSSSPSSRLTDVNQTPRPTDVITEGPSQFPPQSLPPIQSGVPSLSPSLYFSPAETCYWIDLQIFLTIIQRKQH